MTTFGAGNDKLDGGYDIAFGVDFIAGGRGDDEITGMGFLVGSGFKIQPSFTVKLTEIFSKKDTGDTQSSKDEHKKTGKRAKIFDYSIGWDYVSSDTETNTITAVGPLSLVAGGKGVDKIFAKGYFSWIDGKDGNDIIDASESIGAWIEGGKNDDVITGPSHPYAIGSVIFGDEFSASIPFNPAALLSSISLGVEFDWGKSIKVEGGISVLKMSASGKDVIHTGTGLLNFVAGGSGEDTIYAEGKANLILGDEFNIAIAGVIEYDFEKNELKKDFDLPGLHGDYNDTLYGTTNSIDILIGGGGNDTISGMAPNQTAGTVDIDVLFGNDGTDTITGGQGLNLLVGGDGDDTITGGDFANFILGDSYYLGVGNPFQQLNKLKDLKLTTSFGLIPEGSGKDSITGGAGFDFIIGGDARDVIQAGDGVNIVFGDEISLGTGIETDLTVLFDTPSEATTLVTPDVLSGTGNDTILGGDSIDIFSGGKGDDDLRGFGGIDLLFGNDGQDKLCGGDGNDILLGGDGDDFLDGGASNDVHQGWRRYRCVLV